MTEINIAGAIDKLMIFDDPEYCMTSQGECRKIDDWERCSIFEIPLKEDGKGWIVKCDQCKEAFRRSKWKQKLEDMRGKYDKFIVTTDQKYYPTVKTFSEETDAIRYYEQEVNDEKWNDGEPVNVVMANILLDEESRQLKEKPCECEPFQSCEVCAEEKEKHISIEMTKAMNYRKE